MPDFFINRPIFAWVVALLISLVGLLALPMLPVAQYPDIAPPVITIRTTYPGASAQVTEEAVTAVIEKEINGAPGLLYMSATSDSNGMVEIAVTFQQGTDPDIAAVEVQNRLKSWNPACRNPYAGKGCSWKNPPTTFRPSFPCPPTGRWTARSWGNLPPPASFRN